MKFFYFIQISSSPFLYWASPGDIRDIPEPFRPLFDLCFMRHNQLPRNDAPNIYVSRPEIHFQESVKFDILASSPRNSHLLRKDIQHECEHVLCSQLLFISEHSHYCRFGLSDLGFLVGYYPVEHGNDISSPKQDGLIFYLHNGSSYDIRPYCKTMKFIETKVAALKLQGFNQ